MDFGKQLRDIVSAENVLEQEPLSKYTTFRTGGPARWFILPRTEEEVVRVLRLCRERGSAFYVMGRGSNLLVSDTGYDGTVLWLPGHLSGYGIEGNKVHAQAGASLMKVAVDCVKAGLKGLTFAGGIPGSVGGGICMNCGAYGGEICQVLAGASVLYPDTGEIRYLTVEELELSYRSSRIMKTGGIVLSADFILEASEDLSPEGVQKATEEELKRLAKFQQQRREKQPLEYASAGSTFKRPEGAFAGKLIMDCGLAGYQVGDAQVSKKHCGFVINRGNATSDEIYRLCCDVQKIVREKTGYELELEVQLLGQFSSAKR